MEQLLSNYLDQPGLVLSDLRDVLPIVDRLHAATKLTNGMARLEFEMRKVQSTTRDPLKHLEYNQTLENFHEKPPASATEARTDDELMAILGTPSTSPSTSPPGSPPVSPPVSPAAPPATLPLTGASEESQE